MHVSAGVARPGAVSAGAAGPSRSAAWARPRAGGRLAARAGRISRSDRGTDGVIVRSAGGISARSPSIVAGGDAIAPSILSADFSRFGEAVRLLEASGADWVHVDVMDGSFVPTITLGPATVAAIRPHTSLPLDVHLMVVDPECHLEAFAAAGADQVTVHAEPSSTVHLHRALGRIRDLGLAAGVALCPATDPACLLYALDVVDTVLVMSVNPGAGGQAFIPNALEKIRAIRRLADAHGRPDLRIEVDGGINADTAGDVLRAGADALVAGSAVFGDPKGVEHAIRQLRGAKGRDAESS